jgi:hypothetical protein
MQAVALSDGVKVTLKVPFVLPWLDSPIKISDHKSTVREADGALNLAPIDPKDKGEPCKD